MTAALDRLAALRNAAALDRFAALRNAHDDEWFRSMASTGPSAGASATRVGNPRSLATEAPLSWVEDALGTLDSMINGQRGAIDAFQANALELQAQGAEQAAQRMDALRAETARLLEQFVGEGAEPPSDATALDWADAACAQEAQGQSPLDSLRLSIEVHGATAWQEGDGWRLPLMVQLFRPNVGRHVKRLALCRMVVFQGLLGMSDFDEESLRLYEERARLVFRSLQLASEHRRQRLEIRLGTSARPASDWRELPLTDGLGRVEASVWFPDMQIADAMQKHGRVPFEVRLVDAPTSPPARAEAILAEREGLTVISDIDDTVKVTEVFRGHQAMLRNTFFRDFQAVDGMAELFRFWARERGANFQFVSKSPPELHGPLLEFLHAAGFPPATLHLCPLLSPSRASFKLDRVEALLNEFPARRFVLVGDSGERDAEVYAEILRRYPKQVEKIFIREVSPNHPVDPSIFAGLNAQQWQVFQDASEISLPEEEEVTFPSFGRIPWNVNFPKLDLGALPWRMPTMSASPS